ncbi:MAG: DUF5947 family protein [Marmoricola sp.]
MSGDGSVRGAASTMSVLRTIRQRQPPDPNVHGCDMCAEPIGDEHSHVVDLHSRGLLCTCRGCYLLFSSDDAEQRYQAVPDRYLSFPDLRFNPAQWDALQIPVGLAFFFVNSLLGKTIAFYPGPAGVTESELPLESWDSVLAANPAMTVLRPDVEALLLRAPAPDQPGFRCYLVPIDTCYELAGRLRMVWHGFDGGSEARQAIEDFFARTEQRSTPAPEAS